jgi:O-antigen/teichoic acid export membrane protein
MVAARYFSQESVGAYSLAVTYSVGVLAVASWGMDQLLIRDVAQAPAQAASYLGRFFTLRLILSGFFYGGLWLVLKLFHPYADQTIEVILIIGLSSIPDSLSEICQAVFIAREKVFYPSIVSVALALVRIGLGAAILWMYSDLILFAWVFPLTGLASLVANLGLVLIAGIRPKFYWDFRWIKKTLMSGASLAAINILLMLNVQGGVVLVSLLISEKAVALYGAANAIFTALAMLPSAWQMAIFPLMSRLYARSDSKFEWFYKKLHLYLAIGALALILAFMAVADWVILQLYGPSFRESIEILRILIVMLFFSFLNIPNTRLMIISNRQDVLALFLFASVAINASITWVLIASSGVTAVAITRLLSLAFFFLMNYWFVYCRIKRIDLLALIGRPLLAGAVALLILLGLGHWAPIWRVIVPLPVYGTLLWLLRAVPREDWSLMLRLYRGTV